MHSGLVPRRRFLSSLAATSLVGLAGCIDDYDGLQYRLFTTPTAESLTDLTDGFVLADPTAIHAQEAIDYSDVYKQSVVDALLSKGTAESVQWQLAYDRSFGTTTRPRPVFVERDGTYYSITETAQTEFTEDRWVFYLDLVDKEPTSSDTVVTGPPSSLSETDQLVVKHALRSVQGHGGAYDVDNRPLQGRGPDFHHEMDPEASELVPSPPFDYLKLGDEYPQYLVPRAEKGPVELTRYTFTIEEVASSREELERHVESNVVDAEFDTGDDAAVVDVVRAATDRPDGRIYTEHEEMSDELKQVVDRLGMSPYIPEDVTDRTTLNGALFSFEGEWYRASFKIRRM
ncbi:hypothetical protein [Halogranum rubrum]|uniref:Uncharacterized protein n=1 Tax=Halogranum salarium B-1 TaxID=1210908 RepID=J3F089_9EURY|nr:hypothetical protein [Halogranum salarium]EJN61452.1 hypothetical protein HSB1_04930 [Halogranum salarium B-1]